MSGGSRKAIEVSVVVGSVESGHSIARCLDAIGAALVGVAAEVFVVDASRDASAEIAEQKLGRERVIRCAPGTLTPDLWAIGIARTTGRIVALTTGHFVVEPNWITSLSSALAERTLGVAGRVDVRDDATVTDWAVFYLRYSEFLEESGRARAEVGGIPADNAAYDGDSARRFVRAGGDGFWEVEFHRQLHESGRTLALVSGATGWYGRSFPFRTILTHRFHHGRHAGAWRARHGQRRVAVIVLASPAVPILLASRVWGRVRALAPHRRRYLRSLPAFLIFAAAWALGEAIGALTGAPAARRTAPASA
jgi:hypothetical protein